uniref:protein-serine/threonine phosphatase n=1 Tax=Ditylenchus dipsaci TaxID=166011 RepID=A0A915CRW1_9BILA
MHNKCRGLEMLSSDTSGKMFDLQSFMDRHMVFRAKVDYTYEEVEQLIEQARAVIQNESALCEITAPVNVVGDIHGQFTDLQRIFSIVGTPGENRYLFLGDYVDRGEQSMECICVLLGYKIAFPDRIFLLRGNTNVSTSIEHTGFMMNWSGDFIWVQQ